MVVRFSFYSLGIQQTYLLSEKKEMEYHGKGQTFGNWGEPEGFEEDRCPVCMDREISGNEGMEKRHFL